MMHKSDAAILTDAIWAVMDNGADRASIMDVVSHAISAWTPDDDDESDDDDAGDASNADEDGVS